MGEKIRRNENRNGKWKKYYFNGNCKLNGVSEF